MTRLSRLRERLEALPRAHDALVAVVAVLLGMAPVLLGPEPSSFQLRLTAWSLSLLVLASVPLVFRRRYTKSIWAGTVCVGLVATLIDRGPSPAYIPAIVALYALATRSRLQVTVSAALTTALAPGLVVGLLADASVVDALFYGLTAWCLLAAASGVAVRTQRAVVAEAQDRARQAEATRDEEAQRRVAEERMRIARELHDVVAHHISVINVQAGAASRLVLTDPEKANEALAHVRAASQVVLREVPGLLGLLRSDDEPERAPTPTLSDTGALIEAARKSGLDVAWRTTGSPVPLSPSADLAAYRVLQEALTNATRHGTGSAHAMLSYDATSCTVEVRNERRHRGAVFDTDRHGLVGMRERIAAAGGEITVGPEGERDWVVRARLPVQQGSVVEVS